MIEVAHAINDFFLDQTIVDLGQVPSSVVLQLRVAVAQKFKSQVSAYVKTVLKDGLNVAKDIRTVFSKVKAFVDLLVDEAEPYELAEIVFVLT